jgi:hypothetical protein
MDTDYLTPMAYHCIILANEASDILKSEIGAACSQFEDEDEYLKGILKFVIYIEKEPEDYLESWSLLDELDISIFKSAIKKLRKHIENTIKIPIKDRGEIPEYLSI